MPTIRIVDDNVIEFIDSNGDVAAREEYNESTNQLDFVDEAGAPLPVKLGDVDAQGVSSATAPTDGTDVARKTEIDSKADLTAPDGVVVNSQVPDLAISNTTTVADETERLALTDVEEGDLAVQQDTDEGYIFLGGDPSVAANWSLLSNFDPVAAIDGADISPNSVTAASGTYSGTFTVNDLIANTLDADTLASPLDANTKDITNVGAFSSDSVNTENLSANNVTLSQDNIGSTTVHRGDVVPVAGGSTETVFDVSDPVDIISGHIHGYLQDTVRVTWSDGSTDEIYPNARVSAETQGNDIFSISVLPPVEDVTELTFVNDSGAVFDYSYYVLTI